IRRRESLPITEKLPLPILERESLKPFDSRAAMVDQIAAAYATGQASPPPSAPSSPGRVFSIPVFGSSRNLPPDSTPKDQLSPPIKEAMLSDWTKGSCIASVENENVKTASVNGSKSGTTPSGARNLLTVNGNGNNSTSRAQSLQNHHHHRHHENSRPPSAAYGLVGGLSGLQKLRRTSAQEESPTRISTSSRNSTVRVDELKRVLAGNPRNASPLRLRQLSVSSSESMASGEFSPSEISYTHAAENIASADFAQEHPTPKSTTMERQMQETAPRPTPLAPPDEAEVNAAALASEKSYLEQFKYHEDVPPVPPLPPLLSLPGGFPTDTAQASSSSPTISPEVQRPSTAPGQYAPQDCSAQFMAGGSRSLKHGKSKPGSRRDGDDTVGVGAGRVDLGRLLGGIEVPSGKEEGMGIGKPPY
ncbi:MAG: plasma membrane localization protein, partial [Pleopsidium flavum]